MPTSTDDLDLTSADLYRSGFPHDVFPRLRAEAPVWWQQAPPGFRDEGADDGFWVLTRHADVQAANRDSELFTAFEGPSLVNRPETHGAMLVSMDGRDHTRQRELISAGFTPRMVGRLEEQMRRWSARITDRRSSAAPATSCPTPPTGCRTTAARRGSASGGGGPRFCLGANLARREMITFFAEPLRRTKSIEATGPLTFAPLGIFNSILVQPQSLPARLA